LSKPAPAPDLLWRRDLERIVMKNYLSDAE
jgi:hypothetical protein